MQAQVQHGEITREGVDELTLRAGKAEQLRTFIDTTHVETWTNTLWKTGLQLDQATYKDVKEAEVEELVLQVCGDEQGSQCSQPCGSSRQKRMEKRGTSKKKKRYDAHHDRTYAKKPESRNEVRKVLSSAHLEGPTLVVFGGAGEWKIMKTRIQRPEGLFKKCKVLSRS